MAKTGTRVCGDCWHILRPDAYEPYTFIDGKCSMCGQYAYVHRVRKAEVAGEIARWTDNKEMQNALINAEWIRETVRND